jgi:hypothetical protein
MKVRLRKARTTRTVGDGGPVGGNDGCRPFDRLSKKKSQLLLFVAVALLLLLLVSGLALHIIRMTAGLLNVAGTDRPYFGGEQPDGSAPLPPPPPPEACSEDQMGTVRRLFPRGSTSPLTRCPHATWWDEHMYEVFLQEAAALSDSLLASSSSSPPSSSSSSSSLSSSSSPSFVRPNGGVRLGLALGCNKGDDAIELLAKLSGNRNISVDTFREEFMRAAQDEAVVAGGDDSQIPGRACPVHGSTPLDLYHPLWRIRPAGSPPAHVFCVEAATSTANSLKRARDTMDETWRGQFTVTHAAMGGRDGTAHFPIVTAGIESRGLCDGGGEGGGAPGSPAAEPPPPGCEAVRMYTVDTYVEEVVRPKIAGGAPVGAAAEAAAVAAAENGRPTPHNGPTPPPLLIDFLLVDVEGFDWDVLGLGGADATLARVKYLEFEYHSMGSWPMYDLSEVTTELWEKYNFVCYYAGVGTLWRLTNCFQDYFNDHGWSNVACVSKRLDPVLAERMEATFQRQLLV